MLRTARFESSPTSFVGCSRISESENKEDDFYGEKSDSLSIWIWILIASVRVFIIEKMKELGSSQLVHQGHH